MTRDDLDHILEEHRRWRDSDGRDGARAHPEGANLEGAHLEGANLEGAHLHRANLRGARLQGAHLHRALLSFADLRNANLSYADLRGADLDVADLDGANLANVRTNWLTRMTARSVVEWFVEPLDDEQRRQLGMQPRFRAGNACRSTDLARRLMD
jgi:uncharacterized protein YjbI with pentapeptide repeats